MTTPRSKLSDFQSVCFLSSGSYGSVHKVRRIQDNRLYCLKKVALPRNEELAAAAISECHILASLDTSPHIIRYYDSFFENDSLYIVMELGDGNLSDLIRKHNGPLPRDTIWKYFIQVLIGLHFIHSKKILHRDIKSLNVFLSGGNAKLGDFGISKSLATTSDMANTFIGTPLYLSYEVAQGRPYSFSSDCWSLGVLLFEMLTKTFPFYAENQGALLIKIITADPEPLPHEFSEFAGIVNSLLIKDPAKRASTRDLLVDSLIVAKAHQLGIELPIFETARRDSLISPSVSPLVGPNSPTKHRNVKSKRGKKEEESNDMQLPKKKVVVKSSGLRKGQERSRPTVADLQSKNDELVSSDSDDDCSTVVYTPSKSKPDTSSDSDCCDTVVFTPKKSVAEEEEGSDSDYCDTVVYRPKDHYIAEEHGDSDESCSEDEEETVSVTVLKIEPEETKSTRTKSPLEPVLSQTPSASESTLSSGDLKFLNGLLAQEHEIKKEVKDVKSRALAIISDDQFNRIYTWMISNPNSNDMDVVKFCFGVIRFEQAEALDFIRQYISVEENLKTVQSRVGALIPNR
ncbi:hypothetical protein RCL1_003835 [Eukaryota sp. TZLM3-RCL]